MKDWLTVLIVALAAGLGAAYSFTDAPRECVKLAGAMPLYGSCSR